MKLSEIHRIARNAVRGAAYTIAIAALIDSNASLVLLGLLGAVCWGAGEYLKIAAERRGGAWL